MDSHNFRNIVFGLSLLFIYLIVFESRPIFGAEKLETINATTLNMTYKSDENYLCPQNCQCIVPTKRHHKSVGNVLLHQSFLHAKCSSLNDLIVGELLKATLPIHSIDLSYLNLTRLSPQVLDKLTELTSIDLSHNELHEIGHLGRRIKKLNLKHNRLISQKLMKLPPNIQVLNLQHNDITYLPLELMQLTQLHSLELSQNHINCTCETLTVRNWLQERNVFMEQPVICSYPHAVKGKSWLQLKQSLICDNESRKRIWDGQDFDENELMLGDEAFSNDGDNSGRQTKRYYRKVITDAITDAITENGNSNLDHNHDDSDDELKKDFIPLSKSLNRERSLSHTINNIEGSGAEINSKDIQHDGDDDGSGSGDGDLIFSIPITNLMASPTTDNHIHHNTDNADDDMLPLGPDIFKTNIGIFENEPKPLDVTTDMSANNNQHIDDNNVALSPGAFVTQRSNTSDDELQNNIELANADSIKDANSAQHGDHENNDTPATYLLLGIIAFIVLSMVAYVSIKRCKQRRSHHMPLYANENNVQRTRRELVPMDKEHLGKALKNGVPEHLALIRDNQTVSMNVKPNTVGKDVKDGEHEQWQPLMNGSGSVNVTTNQLLSDNKSDEDLQLHDSHEYYPISPRYPAPQSPRASKYGGGGYTLPFSYSAKETNNNVNEIMNVMPPKSPKLSGRYSPVYSPETGRVKIKLTEMPKPKTPMLVTRSRSNAGDIIMTPIHIQQQHPHNNSHNNATIHKSVTNGRTKAH